MFVTGATGAIGVHVVPALIAAGHEVTALARRPAAAAVLRRQGASPVAVSLFDRTGLRQVMEDHQAVANLATAIPSTGRFFQPSAWRANEQIRVEGAAAVVDAALAAGVIRLVQESVTLVYSDGGSEWIDESWPVRRHPLTRPSLAAEANASRFTTGGGAGVALRFGQFYGPESIQSRQLVAAARRHVAVELGAADSYLSLVHLGDAATAVVAALEAPAGVYNVVDDEPLTRHDHAAVVAAVVGRDPRLRLPGRAAGMLGERAEVLTASLRVANERFSDVAGWRPRHPSAREGWAATVAALGPA